MFPDRPLILAALAAGLLLLGSPAPLWACNCGPGCVCGPGCGCGSGPGSTTERVRKNQSSLTAREKEEFVAAVKQLKKTSRPGATTSIYDEYVLIHREAMLIGAIHDGPAFLPWHREFLRRFEEDLQAVNPSVTLPYWDFTVDNLATSSLWSDDFLGGNGDPADRNIVKTGPFRQGEWKLEFDGPDLKRDFGGFPGAPTLPTAADVQATLEVRTYDADPWNRNSDIAESFRNHLTGWNHPFGEDQMHNRVHLWVGGTMGYNTSPNDPVFFLLHANLDRLWVEWEVQHGLNYLPEVGAVAGHNLHDRMSPFGVSPAGVLDHRALGYRYDTEVANPEPAGVILVVLGALGMLGYYWHCRRRGTTPLAAWPWAPGGRGGRTNRSSHTLRSTAC
jgi:tyrosinase